jgi:hypothetical protein
MAEQNFANHTRVVPAFHYFVLPVFLANFISSIVHLVRHGITVDGVIALLVALALIVLAFVARVFALTVQNRVIRLEEQLRLERLMPAEWKSRVSELSTPQLVGLRFASDEEAPALTRRVLTENIKDTKAIKQMIQHWKPDYLRA